jgi:hypothetical protein
MQFQMSRCTLLVSFLSHEIFGSADNGVLAPLLGDGSSVDWWFAYKTNAASFPGCSTNPKCIFGGEVQDYPTGKSLQYILASGVDGKTSALDLHTDCLGSGDDPVAKTFAQIFGGSAPNFVLWNDQFYGDPVLKIEPACEKYCAAPWGHSKGALAWGSDGAGFVLQVTTPDWPGNGNNATHRQHEGNTLGCSADDNVKVAQHFFALRLASAADTKAVLQAMQRASVATDPNNAQLVQLSDSPSDLSSIARSLGKLDTSSSPYQATLSVSSVTLIAKPHSLEVPPWQLVSSIVKEPLRVATWWASPKILSSKAGTPGCWDASLAEPQEVQSAVSGQWDGKSMGMKGVSSTDGNHAKIGHSLGGDLSIFGDMNQMGSYQASDESCDASQNGRGGLFFAIENGVLHEGIQKLLTGDTAPYYGGGPSPPPSPTPPSPTPASPTPAPGPSPPSPAPGNDPCGGAGTRYSTCKAKQDTRCVYVEAKDATECGTSSYGCFTKAMLPSACPEKDFIFIL